MPVPGQGRAPADLRLAGLDRAVGRDRRCGGWSACSPLHAVRARSSRPGCCPAAAGTSPTWWPTSPGSWRGPCSRGHHGGMTTPLEPFGPHVDAELTGRLLVATPELGDGNFERSVVLVLDHDEDGALGVVINRPTPVDVGEVLPTWQPTGQRAGGALPGRTGGAGLGARAGRGARRRTRTRAAGLAAGRRPARAGRPRLRRPRCCAAEVSRLRIFAGYAGWGAGQLEDELAEGAWYVVDARRPTAAASSATRSPRRRTGLWRAVLRRQGGDLAMVSTYLDDPSLN